MSIKGKAYIAGIYEHPTRLATDKTVMQLHAEQGRDAVAPTPAFDLQGLKVPDIS